LKLLLAGWNLFLAGTLAVIFLGLGMYYHDLQINRRLEIFFFCAAAIGFLIFEWLLHGPH